MEKLKRFFWLCSGAHDELLKKCPTEASKYVGIGATVFFTGIFAALACAYALFTVFDNAWISLALGVVWGLMIFNLDRYIVSSMRKEGNTKKELTTALPRIILAILISIVIVKPLEMKIFDKEIQGELTIMEQQTRTAQESEIRLRYQEEQARLNNEIAALKQEMNDKTITRDELMKLAQEEADGTGGTKRRNAGPIYKIKKADADRVDEELAELTLRNEALIKEKLGTLAHNDSLVSVEINSLVKQRLDGPAARMEALSRLTDQSNAIALANWFIILLFIAVETAPVFVKLISQQGPYDHLLKIEEHGFEGQRIEEMAKTNAAIKERNESLSQREKEYIKEKLDLKLNGS
ncbi:MAG TPA: DUF4407 domain-containing protein [Cyclobacteriaceae bacterium]|nr:DUF4407 domain-containing protein [Cyclobacteriaceae bacterium]